MTVDLTSLTLMCMETNATPIERPRSYWNSTSDAALIVARDEYREKAPTFDDAELAADLLQIADDIDDDLARRVAWRATMNAPRRVFATRDGLRYADGTVPAGV